MRAQYVLIGRSSGWTDASPRGHHDRRDSGSYFAMIGNWGPTGTIQGTLRAWFRARAS